MFSNQLKSSVVKEIIEENPDSSRYREISNDKINPNVQHAMLLRMEKDEKTEFYRRLETLTERITMYKNIFYTKQPSFLKNNSISKSKRSIRRTASPLKKVSSFINQ
jgi:hypothetical protein